MISLVDLLTRVIFRPICETRISPFWKSSFPFFTPRKKKILPESWSAWSTCPLTWFSAQLVKVDFLPFGRAILLFYSTEEENNARIVSVVDLLTHVIFSSICESRCSPFGRAVLPFLLHGRRKYCQNRDQRGRLAHSRDFQLNLWKSIFSLLGEQFSFFTPRKKKIMPESWSAWSTCSLTWFSAQFVKVDFLPLEEQFSLFYSTEKKHFVRIVISMVDLVFHVIFTSIQQSWIFLSVENRSPRRRVVEIFQAFFKEFSTCLIDCKRIHHDISSRSREKWGGVLSGVVVVSDKSTRVEHSS